MKYLAPIAIAAASFTLPQTAQADLFLHSNFDTPAGYYNDPTPIQDLTGRNIGSTSFAHVAPNSLMHPSSPNSSGNRIYGTTDIGYRSISPEFSQTWYSSYICRFDTYNGGGVFMSLGPENGPMHENVLYATVLPMGIILGYNRQDDYIIQDRQRLTDFFVLTKYTTNDVGDSMLQLWIDPNTSNLGSPLISYSFTTIQPFYKLSFSVNGVEDMDNSFDELRFGTQLSDVAVVPSPATLAPLLGLALAHRRKR